MTKCASCRVRHLSCDALPICKECTKSGRECSRFNVRFKHLVCPSREHKPADYSKYEFFFSGEQIWVDVEGKPEFVEDIKSTVDTPLNETFEERSTNSTARYSELGLENIEPPASAWADGSTSHTPTIQFPSPSDYLEVTKQGISIYSNFYRTSSDYLRQLLRGSFSAYEKCTYRRHGSLFGECITST